MSKKIKVLFFLDRFLLGGIQSIVYDIINHLDRDKMQIDILQLDDGVVYPMEQTMREMGVEVFQLKGIWVRTPLDFPKYFAAVDNFFKEHHDYDVVHMHSGSKNYYILKSAAKYGIPVRVAHSHNTDFQTKNPVSKMLGDAMKRPLYKYSTHRCGCSKDACEWLFGRGTVDKGESQVVLNGVDCSIFTYERSIRDSVRDELNLEGKFVVGHVGRFENQKNHTFLIDIFAEVVTRKPESVLLLVGAGSLQPMLEEKVANLGLAGKVIFLGFRSDRERIMQAMDIFVFPSLYEGLGIVLIEAQISGLPLVTSTGIPKDLEILPDITYLSLSDGANKWAEVILSKSDYERQDMTAKVKSAGFDITTMIDNLYRMYTQK
ncbi:MAG: glycosyltransferase family 1 protein [Rikenellaceae bacterium]